MSRGDEKQRKTNMWIIIGVIVLIVLLLVWLTMADLWGDTDVAACITGEGVAEPPQ